MARSRACTWPYVGFFAVTLGVALGTILFLNPYAMLIDVHTHHRPAIPEESIWNVPAGGFRREKGFYYSVGIHPWQVKEDWEPEFLLVKEIVSIPTVLAVGEAGLDRFAAGNMALQKTVFERQIELSEEWRKPLIIHCVKCFNELIQLKRELKPKMPWIVHGFRNNPFIAERLLNEECYLSFGERYQTAVLQMIPEDRLLTETDEGTAGIRTVIRGISERKNLSYEALLKRIDENVRSLFFKR